jgi:hypothetical protein
MLPMPPIDNRCAALDPAITGRIREAAEVRGALDDEQSRGDAA